MSTAVLVLGTADWSSPIETNQHHVTRILAGCFDSVTFVESQGLRRPRPTATDLRRVRARLTTRPAAGGRRPAPGNVRIVSPRCPPVSLAPGATHPLIGRALERQLGAWLAADRRVLWTYTPVTLGLERHALATVYHCVDLLAHQQGVPERLITGAENRLARVPGVVALASSTVVEASLTGAGFRAVTLLENVADADLFAGVARRPPAGRPRVVFAGRLTDSKIDRILLAELARSTELDLVLAGPEADDWTGCPQGASATGNLPAPELAELLSTASVGLIPYRATPYTEGVFPLKVYEYLAAGVAVVSTPMPSLAHLDLPGLEVGNGADFVRLVDKHLGWPTEDEVAERRAVAADHSWATRRAELESVVARLLR